MDEKLAFQLRQISKYFGRLKATDMYP